MNLKEYKKWLEEHANKEERQAYKVVEEILNMHYAPSFPNEQIYPRKRYEGIEFDLLILLQDGKGNTHRVIGVEFKETDIHKVIAQAIIRKRYTDYMYIATKPILDVGYFHIFMMCYYGIGWIVFLPDIAYPIIKSRRSGGDIDSLVNYLIEKEIEKKVDEKIEAIKDVIDRKIQRRLDEWVSCQK